jgi:glycosyltransferase involved in cell wall biosynthesis
MSEHWHIMDFGLTQAGTHHYWGARAISSELRRRRIDVTIYGYHFLSRDLTDMRVVPLFRPNMYWPVTNDVAWLELETFVLHNWVVLQDLGRLDRAQFAGATVVFPTVTYNQLLAVARWIAEFAPAAPPKAVLVLMFPPEWKCWPGDPPGKGRSYYHAIWSNLPRESRRHLLLCTQTEEIAREYESLFGFRPTPLPYYLGPVAAPSVASSRDHEDALVSYLGGGRSERGFEFLPAIISSCLATNPTLRFFVQVQDSEPPLEDIRQLGPEGRVSAHSGTMDPDAYLAAMRRASLILLPLDPARYRTQSSGVYWQACMAGTPVVVPAGTWMAERVRAHGHGVEFGSYAPDSIAAAILGAQHRMAELRANAARYADLIRTEHGTAAYVDAIARLPAVSTAA